MEIALDSKQFTLSEEEIGFYHHVTGVSILILFVNKLVAYRLRLVSKSYKGIDSHDLLSTADLNTKCMEGFCFY